MNLSHNNQKTNKFGIPLEISGVTPLYKRDEIVNELTESYKKTESEYRIRSIELEYKKWNNKVAKGRFAPGGLFVKFVKEDVSNLEFSETLSLLEQYIYYIPRFFHWFRSNMEVKSVVCQFYGYDYNDDNEITDMFLKLKFETAYGKIMSVILDIEILDESTSNKIINRVMTYIRENMKIGIQLKNWKFEDYFWIIFEEREPTNKYFSVDSYDEWLEGALKHEESKRSDILGLRNLPGLEHIKFSNRIRRQDFQIAERRHRDILIKDSRKERNDNRRFYISVSIIVFFGILGIIPNNIIWNGIVEFWNYLEESSSFVSQSFWYMITMAP